MILKSIQLNLNPDKEIIYKKTCGEHVGLRRFLYNSSNLSTIN